MRSLHKKKGFWKERVEQKDVAALAEAAELDLDVETRRAERAAGVVHEEPSVQRRAEAAVLDAMRPREKPRFMASRGKPRGYHRPDLKKEVTKRFSATVSLAETVSSDHSMALSVVAPVHPPELRTRLYSRLTKLIASRYAKFKGAPPRDDASRAGAETAWSI